MKSKTKNVNLRWMKPDTKKLRFQAFMQTITSMNSFPFSVQLHFSFYRIHKKLSKNEKNLINLLIHESKSKKKSISK